MSYLKDDALAFFAQRIAPNIATITWHAEVRSLIVKRFGTPQVSSIVTAKESTNFEETNRSKSISMRR